MSWHPPLLTTTPHQREDVLALDRFNVHRCRRRRVFSDTALKLETRKATVRYLYHSATAATLCSGTVELWFQQDGATCHTARATIDLLKDTFGDRLISRFRPVNWPPRSCDLTPLDYFLWGYVKLLVYADKPQTLDHLEDSIRRVIADIRPQMLEKVIENWTSRLDYIRASRGSPMPEILFKM
ncbi:transposable element Tc3 transposase [Trichonephila clavipes]|uniref:Transposable element Tc3 transposase n=1 Tax=Trichonephila clavipes TaxID=2585209 RepID=A0A8X6V6U6_TRICX|nr:transposable element Tc3 transposase [Trichonephila clavipes]